MPRRSRCNCPTRSLATTRWCSRSPARKFRKRRQAAALHMPALQVEQLRKAFGDLVAVDGISFHGEAGEIFGLLGPNGAGKSTTLNCISGLLVPSGGRILVL